MSITQPAPGPVIDAVTVYSLLAALGLLVIAYALSVYLLPDAPSHGTSKTGKTSSSSSSSSSLTGTSLQTIRIMFIWHMFDCLIHFCLEGAFLYHCFFTFTTYRHGSSTLPKWIPGGTGSRGSLAILTPPEVFFLQQKDRLYGSFYGESPLAKLWQVYARADRRWGGADLTIISLELLTVFCAGPLAAYICYELVRATHAAGKSRAANASADTPSLWFWAIVLATGELYGGFMTFAPEWLSGNTNLDTSNWLYLWLYLTFFNGLWVVFPLWVLRLAYNAISRAFAGTASASSNSLIGGEGSKKRA